MSRMVTPREDSGQDLPAEVDTGSAIFAATHSKWRCFPDGHGPEVTGVNVLGTPVDGWTLGELLDCVVYWATAAQDSVRTVLYANVHVLNSAYSHPILLEELRRASTVYCDGSGVRLGAFLLGERLPRRMTGADWIDRLCERATHKGLPLFLLGGAYGVADRAAHVLRRRHPGLPISGTHHGYGDETDPRVVETVNQSGAKILLVGMGTPRQELWIRRYREQLRPRVAWAVGAMFDFVAGIERRGPQWMLDHHLEWAARLRANPGSHWRRYLIGNPLFVARVLRQRSFGLPARLARSDADVSQ
jgi:N-acetylglucosaminyldiphosphoundecaprenol N-acetyl-beta-D-mannosaminyltransferase